MSLQRIVAALFTALLLVGGCSDDESTTSGSNESVDSDDGESSQAEDARSETFEEDLAVAEDTVLTLDDLPVGWTSKPRDEEDDDDEFDEQFADCLGVPLEEVTDSDNPKAESETFVSDDESEVEAEVVVSPTLSEAADDFEFVTSDEYLQCIRDVLPNLMEAAADEEGGDFEIEEASIGPLRTEDAGERSAAFRMTISVAVDSFSVDLYFDILFAQVGRATMQVSNMSVFTAPDASFTQSLLDLMVDRVDTAAVS